MEKWNIKGDKILKDTTFCKTCKDGEVWADQKFYRTGIFGSKNTECICSVCNTKYKLPNQDKFEAVNLRPDNVKKVIYYIFFEKEDDKMSEDLLVKKDLYDLTGECLEHEWVTSHPFRTSEGTFVVKNCRVCGLANCDYNGKVLKGHVLDVVKRLAHNGIWKEQQEQKQKEIENDILSIFEEPEMNEIILI